MLAVVALTVAAGLAATLFFLGPDGGSDMIGPDATSGAIPSTQPDLRIAFVGDMTDEALRGAVAEVAALEGVVFAQGLNRDAAFAEFSELFADCPGLVEVAAQDLGAFPISIKVWVGPDTDVGVFVGSARSALTAGGFGAVDVEITSDAPLGSNDCTSPVTTMAVPAQLEQAGVDLVAEISADGYVTQEEFVRAVEGMAACMTAHGLNGVAWSVDEVGGGWSMDYESPADGPAEQAIYSLCYYSYIPQEELRGEPPIPEMSTLQPVRITCTAELDGYPCSALIDGDPNTTWQVPDGGIGVTITFMFAEPVQITELAFENEPGDAFIRNARARGVMVTTDDLSQPIEFELDDTNELQVIDIQSLRTSTLEVQITSAFPGQSVGDEAPFTDLAIGEVIISGRAAPAAAGTANWLGTGESIADEVLLGLDLGHEAIPGTAIRLAWTPAYNGAYDLALFAYMAEPPEQVSSASTWYCLTGLGFLTGSDTVVVGSSQCSLTLEHLQEQLTFGSSGGGSCVEPLTLIWTIWGIPQPVDKVTFHMSDGTELVGEVTDGIAQVAWGRDIVITSATFAGITEAQTAKLRELYDYAQTCADLNGPGNGGG